MPVNPMKARELKTSSRMEAARESWHLDRVFLIGKQTGFLSLSADTEPTPMYFSFFHLHLSHNEHIHTASRRHE